MSTAALALTGASKQPTCHAKKPPIKFKAGAVLKKLAFWALEVRSALKMRTQRKQLGRSKEGALSIIILACRYGHFETWDLGEKGKAPKTPIPPFCLCLLDFRPGLGET
jgi:hypothetical protein